MYAYSMNKLITISLIGALSFTLTGCTLLNKNQNQNQERKTEQTSDQEKKKETGDGNENKNVFNSIKDAVTKQIGLKCEYEDEEGVKATTYIKGNNVYLESEVDSEDVKMKFKGVIKDQKYYLWNDENKQGMVFDLSKVDSEEMDSSGTQTKVQTQDEIIAKLEQNKNKCKPENISASRFDTPSDIQFMEWNW